MSIPAPEAIHPALWRASQLGYASARCITSGHSTLDNVLPGGGWPTGALTELLVGQPGIGEVRLLQPVLAKTGCRPVMFLQPPHAPNGMALGHWGVPTANLHLAEPGSVADALWAAEQVLRAGTCAVLLYWQQQVRADALRRLHLAAQSSETAFFLIRPLKNAASQASPAPLRLALTPAPDGVSVRIIKRRGPAIDEPLFIPLYPSPFASPRHVPVDRRVPSVSIPRSVPTHVDA